MLPNVYLISSHRVWSRFCLRLQLWNANESLPKLFVWITNYFIISHIYAPVHTETCWQWLTKFQDIFFLSDIWLYLYCFISGMIMFLNWKTFQFFWKVKLICISHKTKFRFKSVLTTLMYCFHAAVFIERLSMFCPWRFTIYYNLEIIESFTLMLTALFGVVLLYVFVRVF